VSLRSSRLKHCFGQLNLVSDEQTSSIVETLKKDPGLPSQKPTTSYWQVPPHPVLSKLQSPTLPSETDVVIIGSGITSASIAHHLLSADPTIRVVVLEARAVSSGATGRNGGHILELPYEEYSQLVALLGKEQAKKVVAFRLSHLKELLHFAKTVLSAEAAADCEIRAVETVEAVLDESTWQKLKIEVKHFLDDFPEYKNEWKLWEKEDAREVWSNPFPHWRKKSPGLTEHRNSASQLCVAPCRDLLEQYGHTNSSQVSSTGFARYTETASA
jgi:hypothetical protein